MFIKQVYYGVLRYSGFLTAFTDILFSEKSGTTERKDTTLYQIITYLITFRLTDLPINDFKALVLVSYKKYIIYI